MIAATIGREVDGDARSTRRKENENLKPRTVIFTCLTYIARFDFFFLFSVFTNTHSNADASESCRCHLLTEKRLLLLNRGPDKKRKKNQRTSELLGRKSRPQSQATINTTYTFSNVLGG